MFLLILDGQISCAQPWSVALVLSGGPGGGEPTCLSPSFLSFLFKIVFIYFWLCWVIVAARELSLVAESRGYLLVAVCKRLTVVASLVEEHRLYGVWAVVVVACGLSYHAALGIFLDQGSKQCPLLCKVDS